ncbi:hypothetical protein AAE478_009401 [Parahypoxylon ruwenzoriense]
MPEARPTQMQPEAIMGDSRKEDPSPMLQPRESQELHDDAYIGRAIGAAIGLIVVSAVILFLIIKKWKTRRARQQAPGESHELC